MGYQRMTQAEWADLIAKQGYENAVRTALQFGTVLEETGAPPSVVDPSLAARPMMTAAPASATVAPAIQGTTPMQPITGGLTAATEQPTQPQDTFSALEQKLLARPEQLSALRKQQFEQGEKRINQLYAGPSDAERLWALSQAFLAPRKYRGFAGTLQNVTQALGGMSAKRREAEMKRGEALARLQESYQTGKFGDESDALELQYKIAKERNDARKPGRGTWSESEGKFVSQDTPSPTKRTAVVGGFTLRQYTDGTLRMTNADGSQSVYNIDGVKLGDIPAGGTR